jgi:uncharacterized membrane protein
MLQRRKKEPVQDEMADPAAATPAKVVLNDTIDDIDTRALLKNVGFFLLGLLWKLLLMMIIIAIIGTALDFHNEWKRASRMTEVEIAKARGVLDSSTCRYFAGTLDDEDKRKWEKSAIAETDHKCVQADIINGQWHFIMKLRMLTHQYLPYESGKFGVFLKDAVFYIVSVMFPIMGVMYKAASWFTPIMTATNTFNNV